MSITKKVVLGLMVAMLVLGGFAVKASAITVAEVDALAVALNLTAAQKASLMALVTPSAMTTGSAPMAPLQMGSSGAEVTKLQTWLISKGFSIPAGATGFYGAQTVAAVKAFQMANNITPASGYYGSITAGVVASMMPMVPPVTTPGTNPSTPSTSLEGGAGDITVTERSSGVENEVLEGDEDVKVLGFEVEPDGSDVAVTSVRVEFKRTGSGGSTRLDRYVDSVSIMMGDEVVGSADASDFNKSGTTYSRNISIDNSVVSENEKGRFYVAITASNNVDSDDLDKDWIVGVGQIRFEDATGAILTDSTGDGVTGGDNGPVSETFSFQDLSSSGDVELKIENDDDSVNDAHTEAVDDSSDTNDVDVLSFTLEAEGSDINLNQLDFGVSSTGAGVTEIANDFRLLMDGEEVGDVTVDVDCDGGSDGFGSTTDTAICVSVSGLDDDDVVINEGDTVNFTLQADINDIDGAFSSGDKLSVTLNSDVTLDSNGSVDAEDSNGDALTISELSGSANSTDIQFLSSGVTVTLVSADETGVPNTDATTADDEGEYVMTFDVTAVEDTAYVELGAVTRGTAESDTGANYVIQSEDNSFAATSTGTVSSDLVRVSGGSTSGEFVRINAGQTARFKLTVRFNPANADAYRVYLYSVNFAGSAVNADQQQVLTPEPDYRTSSLPILN